ncbi:MAG: cyclase family protein [Candidatus Bathyarchaeia archaeon]
MKVKKIVDLTYPLRPKGEQRKLRLISIRTLENSYSNEYMLEMHAHIGTHVESPYHCIKSGKTIDKIPLDKFVGEAAVVDLSNTIKREIDVNDLIRVGNHIVRGDIVILKTGYDDKFIDSGFQSEEYKAHSPYLTTAAVKWLISREIKLLGIDFWSIEEYPINPKIGEPRHKILFEHEIPLIHSLVNTTMLDENRVFFVALPLFIRGLESSPVRAVAIIFE